MYRFYNILAISDTKTIETLKMDMKWNRFSVKVGKGDLYRVIRTSYLPIMQIAGKPVCISCHVITKEIIMLWR